MGTSQNWLTIDKNIYKVTATIFGRYIYDELVSLIEENNSLTLDLSDTVVRNDFVVKVAEWVNNGVIVITNDSLTSLIAAYIQTGYFVKRELKENYKYWLIDLIEKGNFPLMILDNRLINSETDLYIVQFLDTTQKELRYRKLRSFATNPKTLQLAIEDNREIWELSTVFVDELNKADCGFRFASNEKERAILDILTGVLNGNKKLSNL
jgi:hypothetical protein